jgi:putative heme transporter
MQRLEGGTGPGSGGDRGTVVSDGLKALATWSLRFVVVVAALWLLQKVFGLVWVALLPVLLAVILSTVLRPPVAFLVRHRFPPALAALTTMVVGLGILSVALYGIIRSIVTQSSDLANQATRGLDKLQRWIQGPPLSIRSEQISAAVDSLTSRLQSSAGSLASGALSGASAAVSVLVNAVLVLLLTFFFVKDGPRFLPWLRKVSGQRAGRHLTEVLTRIWQTVSGFIRTQAVVSAVDAVFIGLGLLVLDVPLVAALTALTFLGGFIPIVGAFVAGGLAVLVAVVTNGTGTALGVLAVIVVVQQLESNLLSPVLQSRSMNLHPVVVVLSVTFGASVGGIVGAFFAVPAAAALAEMLRYVGEQADLRSGLIRADETSPRTPEGRAAAVVAEALATEARQPYAPPPVEPRPARNLIDRLLGR